MQQADDEQKKNQETSDKATDIQTMQEQQEEQQEKQQEQQEKSFGGRLRHWLLIILIACVGGVAITFIITAPFFKGTAYYDNEGKHYVSDLPDTNDPNSGWIEKESEYSGAKCKHIYMRGDMRNETKDYLIYYVYNSERAAKKAYNEMKENGYDVNEEGENYFVGWQKDVWDAAIEAVVCQNDKMIVVGEFNNISEWAYEEGEEPDGLYLPELKQYVIDNFAAK